MEKIIYQIWKNRLFSAANLRTTSGEKLQIMDCGTSRSGKNIFNDAKIRIGDKTWAGNVVLHCKSSDWEKDIHGGDSCTDNIILHVTLHDDCSMLRRHGEEIQQLCLTHTAELDSDIFESRGGICRCLNINGGDEALDRIRVHGILSKLLMERIEERAEYIEKLHENNGQRWDDTLFRMLMRSFGFGIHGRQFEELAATIDFSALGKHSDNLLQVEAIFFGQAGLLEEESIPYYYREFALNSGYFKEIKREFQFLQKKFNLKVMSHTMWNGCGTPHVRIARLAAIYNSKRFSMSNIAESGCIKDLHKTLSHTLHSYWQNHTCFGGTETYGNGDLKQTQIEVIIINAIVPMLYVYGRHRKEYALCEKAEDYLHSLRNEENSVVRRWREQGFTVSCAADSQALLQLSKAYCSRNRCRDCQIAYRYISSAIKCS